VFGQIAQRVLMPALSESHRSDETRLEQSLRRAKHALLPLAAVAMAGGVAVSPAFFHYLYDPRYADAGWIAQLAQISLWSGMLHESNGRALLALGDSRSWAVSNALRTAVSGAGCVLGFGAAGLPGVLVGFSLGGFAGSMLVGLALRRHGVRVGSQDLAYTVLALGAGSVCGLLPLWIARGSPGDAIPLLTLAIGTALLAPPTLWLALRHREALFGRR
jgi:O-antigen/teichoic acid export membrane protein